MGKWKTLLVNILINSYNVSGGRCQFADVLVREQKFSNRRYGRPVLGFGYVVFVQERDADAALQDMKDKELVEYSGSLTELTADKGPSMLSMY